MYHKTIAADKAYHRTTATAILSQKFKKIHAYIINTLFLTLNRFGKPLPTKLVSRTDN